MTKLAKWHVEEILENFVLGGFPVKDDDRFLACSSILTLVVNNIGSRPVTIDNVVYKHGVTVTSVTEENHPEGLISPDAFNGKSLLSDFMEGVDLLD